jgi:hypothetical protein
MNEKLNRLNALIRYLIWKEQISYLSPQKDISDRIDANNVSISNALNGNEKYLTDKLLERINNAYGKPFNIEWLLHGDGEMYKDSQIVGEISNPTISGNSGNSNIIANVQGEVKNITNHQITEETIKRASFGYQDIIKTYQEHAERLLCIIEKLSDKYGK